MDGLLSGLSAMGLGNLENVDIFADPNAKKDNGDGAAQEAPKVQEKDLVYDKAYTCPVCDREFATKVMKTGKAKLLGTDKDLRPRYDGIDAQKYDVILCPNCGYAGLTRFFPQLTSGQVKLVKEQICRKVKLHKYTGEIYTFEEAIERYQLALANAVVKRAKNSEKAYICLKTSWLLRGYEDFLKEQPDTTPDKLASVKAASRAHLQNAYKGFTEALKSESFPMCGMDEMTINYLLTVMAMEFKELDNASRMVQRILTSSTANARIKDKARDLKEEIMAEIKKTKQ